MTDEMIMEAVKNGDLQKVSVLFERYHKRIYNFLARMTIDRDLAEDLTQNVFLRIIKYRSSYREGMRFQSWIYQVARNIFSDHYQAHKNKLSDFITVEKISDHLPESEETYDREEQEIADAFEALLSGDRELLLMKRFQKNMRLFRHHG